MFQVRSIYQPVLSNLLKRAMPVLGESSETVYNQTDSCLKWGHWECKHIYKGLSNGIELWNASSTDAWVWWQPDVDVTRLDKRLYVFSGSIAFPFVSFKPLTNYFDIREVSQTPFIKTVYYRSFHNSRRIS